MEEASHSRLAVSLHFFAFPSFVGVQCAFLGQFLHFLGCPHLPDIVHAFWDFSLPFVPRVLHLLQSASISGILWQQSASFWQ